VAYIRTRNPPRFSPDERVEMIRETIRDLERGPGRQVSGLSSTTPQRIGATHLIRSLRRGDPTSTTAADGAR